MKHAELIARLEATEVGSRELDAEIWDIEDDRPRVDLGDECAIYKQDSEDRVAFDSPPPYTTSLDAALALADRALPGCGVTLNRDEDIAPSKWWAHVSVKRDDWVEWIPSAEQNTPALALCTAILRALGQGEEK